MSLISFLIFTNAFDYCGVRVSTERIFILQGGGGRGLPDAAHYDPFGKRDCRVPQETVKSKRIFK